MVVNRAAGPPYAALLFYPDGDFGPVELFSLVGLYAEFVEGIGNLRGEEFREAEYCSNHDRDFCDCYKESLREDKRVKIDGVIKLIDSKGIEWNCSNVPNVIELQLNNKTIFMSLKSKMNMLKYRYKGSNVWYESYKNNLINKLK